MKYNKKKLWIVVIVIVIILVGLFIHRKSSNKSVNLSMFNPNQPILVRKDNKYGYINTNGKFVIEPKYYDASSFNGKFAVVEEKIENENGYTNRVSYVIDTKGNVKAQAEYSSDIEYISEYDIWIINNKLYDGSLKLISGKDNLVLYKNYGYLFYGNKLKKTVGIMTSKGKISYTYNNVDENTSIDFMPSKNDQSLKERYCKISVKNANDEKFAIINCDTGKVVYNFTDKYISDGNDNIFVIQEPSSKKTISTIYIQNNKIAYQSDNDSVELDYFSDGYVTIADYSKNYNEQYSYYDTKTNKIVKEKPTSSSTSSLSDFEAYTGLKSFSCGKSYGLMKNDKIALKCEWDDIDFFDLPLYQYLKSKGKNYITAEKNDKTYLINLKKGNIVAEFNTSYLYDNEYSIFIEYNDKVENKKVIYNLLNGKSMQTDSDNYISTYANYVIIREGNKENYYNANFKLIYTQESL